MRYAIFSDIHGNLEALETVLEDIQKYDVQQLICLGDLVGYGANPNECIERIRHPRYPTVAGNHDYAAVGLTDITYFNTYARSAILWTMEELEEDNKNYLRQLPLILEFGDFVIVHSSLIRPEAWSYVLTIQDAEANFRILKFPLCFIGHSHYPFVLMQNEKGNIFPSAKMLVNLQKNGRYLVNVGSVGQPRDNDPRATWFIYDGEAKTIETKKISYDVDAASRKIIAAGLPPFLADRLRHGI